jgi:uncharacterized repeat protein (TIGR01451 family)
VQIRPVLIAVPACAAAGVVTYSFVAAQEPAPPAGYYQPRISPAGGAVPPPTYIRPAATPGSPGNPADDPGYAPALPGNRPTAATARLAPTAGGVQQVGWAAPMPAAGQPPRSRITAPVVIGPAPTDPTGPQPLRPVPVRQVGATDPLTPPAPKVAVPDSVLKMAGPLPPPTITDTAPPKAGDEPKPLPLVPPQSMNPTPPAAVAPPPVQPSVGPLPAAPTGPTAVVVSPALTAATPLPPIGGPETPAPAVVTPPAVTPPAPAAALPAAPAPTFPAAAPLAPRTAPAVTLELDAPKEVGVGQPLTYEMIVRNAGHGAVAGVRVEDELPAGAKLVSSDPPAEQAGERLGWSLGGMDAGAERRIRVTVKPGDEGELRSRAVVSFAAAAEARVKVTRPRVGVAVTAADAARVGDEVVFNIRVSNTGTGTAGRVLVQARLTDGLQRPEGPVIEAELKDLPAGESKPVMLRVLAAKAGPQTCVVTTASDGQPTEAAKTSVNVVEPLLQARVAGPGRCLVRSEPEFKVELANPGSAATDPVQVWAVVPDGFEFVSAGDGGAYQAANRTVVWRLPAVAAGGTRVVGVRLRATAPADGTLKVVAQASGGPVGDVQQAGGRGGKVLEAKADAPVRAEGVPALRFEVCDLDDPVEVGKEAMYEIKLFNQGTGPCTNVKVSCTLADGTAATGATGSTQGRGAGQLVTFDPLPQIGVKGEAVFRVRVKGTAAGDQRFRVQVESDQMRSPLVKEENTRFYKD